MKHSIKVFQSNNVRTEWNSDKEKWYFSIVDVVAVLTGSNFQNARNYWKVLKHRLKEEGNQSVTDCNQLKMVASDGKKYNTDVADTEQLLRLIQSIPSKKAEPFKIWLAKVGYERVQEIDNPELAQARMKEIYLQKGYSDEWIKKRMRGISVRNELTDEWKVRGVETKSSFAILTNLILSNPFINNHNNIYIIPSCSRDYGRS